MANVNQVRGITKSIELGRTLQEDYPEIAILYRNNTTQDIVERLDIQAAYGVNPEVARKGVQYAIAGHDGFSGKKAYPGLIGKRERKRIAQKHIEENGHKSYQERKGIHGRTLEEMQKHGREIIRRLTPQKRREYSALGVISRGQTPITEDEKQLIYELARDEHPHLEIAQSVNGYYHQGREVRSVGAVGIMLHRYIESLKTKAQSD